MPLPNYPEKYDEPAVFTPDDVLDDAAERGTPLVADAPDGVLVCYQPHFLDRVLDARETERVDSGEGLFDFELHRFTDLDVSADLGVVGYFGIGAPTTAMVLEVLHAAGAEAFLSMGWAGCLQPDHPQSAFVVADEGVRDEGVSHHYLPDAERVAADAELVGALTDELEAEGERYATGATWTTDAFFRETRREVEQYRDAGVLTVEMEGAATFAVGDYRGCAAGALYLVSDYVAPGDWDPAFGESPDAVDALPVALSALASRVQAGSRQ